MHNGSSGRRSRRKRWTLADYARFANSKKGKLLTKEPLSSIPHCDSKLHFECNEGHRWKPTATSVKCHETWCFRCARAGDNIWRLRDYASYAIARGGRLLSKGDPRSVPLNRQRLRFRCSRDHTWGAAAGRIKLNSSWCAICGRSKNPWDVERYEEFAAKKGGRLLTKGLRGIPEHKTVVRFKCKRGHTWQTTAGQIKGYGTWCGRCANLDRRKPLDDFLQLADERGGKFIRAGKHRGYAATWSCARGHRFMMRLDQGRNGGWCPECSASRCERITRAHFEQLFARPFPRVRPKWLRNTSGRLLELDGYCEELGLAFEHQGEQHYRPVKHFGRTEHAAIKARDRLKRRLCKKSGVVLIEIPELMERLAIADLPRFIIDRCAKAGIPVPRERQGVKISLGPVYRSDRDTEALARLHLIAKEKEGRCLASEYQGSACKLPFRCKHGHTWTARPQDIRNGGWCMKCARIAVGKKRRLTLELMQQIAGERGGECRSREYTNATTKLRWRCGDCANEWQATPASIVSGSWCNKCRWRRGWERRRARGH